MDSADHPATVARIIAPSTEIWTGCGFVAPGLDGGLVVMTCAHVVGDALGDGRDRRVARRAEPPRDEVLVDFLAAGGPPCRARVHRGRAAFGEAPYGWRPVDDRAPVQDMAVLELIDPVPDGVLPVEISMTNPAGRRDDFTAYAMPDRSRPVRWNDVNEPGGWAVGDYTNAVGHGLIEVVKSNSGGAKFILPGCSGSAGWTRSEGGVVGMVTLGDRDARTALLRPVAHLTECWPPLREAAPRARVRLEGERTALTFLDRNPQTVGFETALARHFGPAPDPAPGRRPLYVVAAGHAREGHEWLRTRLAILPLGLRHARTGVTQLGYGWEYDCGPELGLELMRARLREATGAAGDAPEEIAAAINAAGRPVMIYTTLADPLFTADEEEVVGAWLALLAAVAEAGLTVESYVFLDLLYCRDSAGDCPLARFERDRLPGLLAAETRAPLPALRRVRTDDVGPWFETVLNAFFDPADRDRIARRRADVVGAVVGRFGGASAAHLADVIDAEGPLELGL